MQFSKVDYSKTSIGEYRVTACRTPTEKEPQPQIFSSTVFAKNAIFAQARMLKLLNAQYKIKPTGAVIVETREVRQSDDLELKNYGIKFLYRTRSGLQNAYKEIRHCNRVLAVSDLHQEFGSRHKIPSHLIYIIEVKQLEDDEVTKTKILSYMGNDVMFPVFLKVPNTEVDVVSSKANIFN